VEADEAAVFQSWDQSSFFQNSAEDRTADLSKADATASASVNFMELCQDAFSQDTLELSPDKKTSMTAGIPDDVGVDERDARIEKAGWDSIAFSRTGRVSRGILSDRRQREASIRLQPQRCIVNSG